MDVFFKKIWDNFWTLFYGSVDRWNHWITQLEMEVDAKEHQIVPSEVANRFQPLPPHAPIKQYEESTFPFNLNDKGTISTGDVQTDAWIHDFAQLNIDIFNLIRKDQTLPDFKFTQKRYLKIIKEVHPDKNQNRDYVSQAISLNAAKESIDHLYMNVNEQIHLFQNVFDTNMKLALDQEETPQQGEGKQSVSGSGFTPFVILFLTGASAGYFIVKKKISK